MKCSICKGNIAAGAEAQKMIVEYVQPNGSIKVFGYMMTDGPLSASTGQLLRAYHHKHYHAARKRDAKGDAAVPTVGFTDDLGDDTRLRAHIAALAAVAADIGKPVGDPHVTEAYKAKQQGGPYRHDHQFRLPVYQLLAHLEYAHGFTPHREAVRHCDGRPQSAAAVHDELHARMTLEATQTARADDPGHIEPPERDWRDQIVADI